MRTGTLLLLLAALPGRVPGVLAGRDLGMQVPPPDAGVGDGGPRGSCVGGGQARR